MFCIFRFFGCVFAVFLGQKLKGKGFTGGSFRKGVRDCEFLVVFVGEGFGVGLRGVVGGGGGFPAENKGKEEGEWGGVAVG